MGVETQSLGPYEDTPDRYEAANGVEAGMPGMADDAGSRDPSATSVAGAVANAMAYHMEIGSDALGLGSSIGDLINLPNPY